jgi:hypothetical protein
MVQRLENVLQDAGNQIDVGGLDVLSKSGRAMLAAIRSRGVG